MTIITDNLPTYKTLGKDINLKHLGLGRYDREIVNGDFVTVENVEALHNGIRIKLMTIWGEMQTSPLYNQFGNRAWGYLKANNTAVTRTAIKEHFRTALQEMRRILSVDDIQISEDQFDPNKLNVTYMVTTITDQVLSGGVVL
jgi:hypothetical protein